MSSLANHQVKFGKIKKAENQERFKINKHFLG